MVNGKTSHETRCSDTKHSTKHILDCCSYRVKRVAVVVSIWGHFFCLCILDVVCVSVYLCVCLDTCMCVCLCGERERDLFILRNWLLWLWKLASLKSGGNAGSLETQGRADAAAQVQGQSAGRMPSSSGEAGLFPLKDWLDDAHSQ